MIESSKAIFPEYKDYSQSLNAIMEAHYILAANHQRLAFQFSPDGLGFDFSNDGVQSIDLENASYDIRLLYNNGIALGAILTDQHVIDPNDTLYKGHPRADSELTKYIFRRKSDRFELLLQYGIDPKIARYRLGKCFTESADAWKKPIAVLDDSRLSVELPPVLTPVEYGYEQELLPDRQGYFTRMFGLYCLHKDARDVD